MSPPIINRRKPLDRATQEVLVAQWRIAGLALDERKRQSIASASAEEHRQAAWDMAQLGGSLPPDPRREQSSGLVEMQRLFAKIRERNNE